MWRRRDGNANTGCIRWPVDGENYRNSREGGMSVYAFWTQHPFDKEPFVTCSEGFSLHAKLSESPVSADIGRVTDVPLLGALLLGTSGGSWWSDEREEFWEATEQDLTTHGRVVVEALNHIYGRPAILFTVLDT